jgi:DNA-binding CsgD family transcriptional regulator
MAPVLVVALTLGATPSALFIALGVLACACGGLPLGHNYADLPTHLAALSPQVVQALLIAGVASVVRAALRAAAPRRAMSPLPRATEARPVGPLGLEHLTPREVEVLRAAASGIGCDELAASLSLSRNTVKTHLARCYDKLGAHNRAEAIVLAVHAGVLDREALDRAADLIQCEERS